MNPLAVNTVRTKVLQTQDGKWKVATEEGIGDVRVYRFDIKEHAQVFFKCLLVSRILVDPSGIEINHGGKNPLALNTIRTKVLQTPGGNWTVVTEEGIWNVKVYCFNSPETAQIFFNGLWVACILVDSRRKEIGNKGWNPWALNTARNYASKRGIRK